MKNIEQQFGNTSKYPLPEEARVIEEDKIETGVKKIFSSEAKRENSLGGKKPSLDEQDGFYGDDENLNNQNLEEDDEVKEKEKEKENDDNEI